VTLGVVFPDPPKNTSLEGVPELGLCRWSLVDLVDAFRRNISPMAAPSVDNLRLLVPGNLKLPLVTPSTWDGSVEVALESSSLFAWSLLRKPQREDPSEPSDSLRKRPRLLGSALKLRQRKLLHSHFCLHLESSNSHFSA
jgi:hypothetical protein